MARYIIDFSTNASRIAEEIQKVNKALAESTKQVRQNKITLELDTTKLRASIDSTFKQLDNQIAAMQRKLANMSIGSRRFQQQATGIGVAQGTRERGGMQARAIQLGAQAEAFDIGSATRLTKQLEAARIEASQISPNTEQWVNLQKQIGQLKLDLKAADRLAENVQMRENLGAFSPGSLNALEAKLTILRNRAREISPSTSEWKKVNAEIVKTEQSIEKQTRRPLTRGERMGAAGGAFLYGGGLGGGVGSAVGGIAGGLMGGVPGAFTGAAIGQVVDNIGAMGAMAAKSAAGVAQLQRGLALASIDANDFAAAQQAIAQSSSTLAIPLEQVYRQFTQLRVNTKEYGMSIKETQEIFEGVVLAVSSVGGSMQDVDGAMRAVVQIFSKGKVQAEELRGQLGERFPGAVVKFAQANKMSFEELQVALEQGKVTVGDFVEFAKKNYQDYAKFSEQIATAPEFAGRRLEKAMSDMQIAIGSVLGPAGAAFQDFATEAIESITDFVTQNKGLILQVGKDFSVVFSGIASAASTMGQMIMKVLGPVYQYIGEVINRLRMMTGTATASTARAEMDASFALMKKHGPGRTRFLQGGIGYMSDKIEYDKASARYAEAEKQFKATGGSAAIASLTVPRNLTFGGPGAGMSLNQIGDSGKAKTKKEKRVPLEQLLDLESQRQMQMRLSDKELRLAELISQAKMAGNKAEAESLESLSQALQIQGKISALQQFRDTLINKEDQIVGKSLTQQEFNNKLQDSNVELYKLQNELKKEFLNLQVSEKEQADDAQKDLNDKIKKQQELNALLEDAAIAAGKFSPEQVAGIEQRRAFEGDISRATELGASQEQISSLQQLQMATPAAGSIQEYIKQLREELQQLISIQNLAAVSARGIGEALGESLTTGVASLIAGTATAKEVFASFLQSVAQALSQAAAQMIATYIAIGIAKMFAGLSGGSSGGGGYASGNVATDAFGGGGIPGIPSAASIGTPGMATGFGFANGGIVPGGFRAFASGGMVAGPTLGLIGEGGEPEFVIPSSKMEGAMKRYNNGARGAGVIPSGRDSASPMEPGGMMTAGPIDVRYTVERINSVDYVTADQFQAGMSRAAQQGALQGEQRTLRKLRNSQTVRSRMGI